MVIIRFICTSQMHSVIAVAAVSAEFAAVDMAVTIVPVAAAPYRTAAWFIVRSIVAQIRKNHNYLRKIWK